METFEHTRRKPLAIQLVIRAKTGHILSAKVCKGFVKSQSVSKGHSKAWNSEASKEKQEAVTSGLVEAKKAANRATTTIACDGSHFLLGAVRDVCFESYFNHMVLKGENKRVDLAIAKLRNDLSRLSRKSFCTTKRADRLQNHLDLYTDYHNKTRV